MTKGYTLEESMLREALKVVVNSILFQHVEHLAVGCTSP